MHGDSDRLSKRRGSERTVSARVTSLVALQDKKDFNADEGRCTQPGQSAALGHLLVSAFETFFRTAAAGRD
jgi:hypothetical protein